MKAVAETALGTLAVDLETEEVEPWDGTLAEQTDLRLNLPRLVAAAAAGSTVVAVVDAKPPLLVSHDAGMTWRASGRGLPAGVGVANAAGDPDIAVFAARNRLYVSRDGGVFWSALSAELPEVRAVAVTAD